MIEIEERPCAVCGPNTPSHVKYQSTVLLDELSPSLFDARQMETKPHFAFHECDDCGLLFANPSLTAKSLQTLYQESKVSPYANLEPHILNSYRPILDRAVNRLTRKHTFVEVGGGSGFVLAYAVERGFQSQIEIEPSKEAAEQFMPPGANAKFICSSFSANSLAPNSVSLFSFFQMLDHLPDPLGFLKEAYQAIEDSGCIVTVLHNTDALSARWLGRHSPIYGAWHTYLFNPNNVTRLFAEAGFVDIEVFPIKNHYPIDYWCYESPLPPTLKKIGRRLLHTLSLGDKILPLSAGNMAVIASKTPRVFS